MKLQDEELLKRKGQHGGGVIDACTHVSRHAVVALLVTPHLSFVLYPVKFERNVKIQACAKCISALCIAHLYRGKKMDNIQLNKQIIEQVMDLSEKKPDHWAFKAAQLVMEEIEAL
ncbi:MAG: hypothetical protein EZS28_036594 [Streblomastix strix]|uniref:Uncharacterized protein n=1 Tax=Streblomastix strix TaxID=222440 RepID=A0A5J4UCF8_9EUKA|nr:MAG: hypothetical protein EZS28_036594 [Streblomastix strix]